MNNTVVINSGGAVTSFAHGRPISRDVKLRSQANRPEGTNQSLTNSRTLNFSKQNRGSSSQVVNNIESQ